MRTPLDWRSPAGGAPGFLGRHVVGGRQAHLVERLHGAPRHDARIRETLPHGGKRIIMHDEEDVRRAAEEAVRVLNVR